MRFLESEWPNVLYKLRKTPKGKNIPPILWRHSYYLQYSSELMFKRSGESFSKGWADFLSNWKGTKLKETHLHLVGCGWPVAPGSLPSGAGCR